LATVHALPITFVPHDEAQARDALEIAHETGITYYDAAFLSLAKQLSATLVTDNPKHQQKSARVSVTALKDYR
jgi:predicted nucleic acid-binding protein